MANCLDRFLYFEHNALKPQKRNDGRKQSNKKSSETTDHFHVFEADCWRK